jgi:hypothetical protein
MLSKAHAFNHDFNYVLRAYQKLDPVVANRRSVTSYSWYHGWYAQHLGPELECLNNLWGLGTE